MYLFFEDKNNKYNNGEIYGSWNDWSTPIKISDYNFIIDNIKIFKIQTNKKVISYKIKINNEFILLNNLFITNDNGFKNNKIFLTEDDYYNNGKLKFKIDQNNKIELLYHDNIIYLCIDSETIEDIYDSEYAEIFGSWDNWTNPININDYNFIINTIKIFVIKTNNINVSYKIKINNKYILLNNLLITNDDGYINNKIIITKDNYFNNGNIKIRNIDNKMMIFNKNELILDVETINGIPNGYGVQYYKNNINYRNIKYYEGEWKNGKFNGKGSHYWRDYKVYEGEWQDGMCNGNGIGFVNLSDYYEGEWKNGEYHGFGIYYINNNKLYEGEWVHGLKHGKGIIYDKNSNVNYTGEFKNGYYNI